MRVDFHMHSTFSDGVETPTALLQHAEEHNIEMMALTDHDEIDGIHELLQQNTSITIITGCEFSGSYKDKDIHILGYNFDIHHKELKEFISFFKEKREARIKEIIHRCHEQGYSISFDTLQRLFPHAKAYGRPHLAQVLIDAGYVQDIQEAFSTILSAKSPCYVPKVKIDVPRIVDLIHQAGGLAVLAHPKLIRNDDYVEELLSYSFDGVEVYHSKHSEEDEQKYLNMAIERNLFVTGGSDYHGNGYRYPYHLGEYVVDSNRVSQFIDIIKCSK